MTKFIRIDEKGTWRGAEHRSQAAWNVDTDDRHDGVSCYNLEDHPGYAIENLRRYWFEHYMWTDLSDYEKLQVTIFEGEQTGEGPDHEDIALPKKTIAEIDAKPFIEKVLEIEDWRFNEGYDHDDDEYENRLAELVKEWL